MTDNIEPETSIKLLVLGDSSVGKSNFIGRFINEEFSPTHISSSGLDLKTKDIQLQNKVIRVQLWDTAGQEKYRSITKNLFLRVQGIIAVFDLTNEDSFTSIKNWINTIKEECGAHMPVILVGNKCDLVDERIISDEEANEYCKKEKLQYFEASTKNDINIRKSIEEICSKIIKSNFIRNDCSFSLDNSAIEKDRPKKTCC